MAKPEYRRNEFGMLSGLVDLCTLVRDNLLSTHMIYYAVVCIIRHVGGSSVKSFDTCFNELFYQISKNTKVAVRYAI